jgi:hypothetical protein
METYPEFFQLLDSAYKTLYINRRRKKWHKKLEKILIYAADMRSDVNKKLYSYGLVNPS